MQMILKITGKREVKEVEGEIEFDEVSFSYRGEEKKILNDLNLKIRKGETVAFVGGSGSGKTTILNLAIGFLKADSGQVRIDGKI